MLSARRAIAVWRESRKVAKQQTVLAKCPCCFADKAELLFKANDHSTNLFVSPGLKNGEYSLCHNCGVVYAALRSTPQSARAYYELFSKTQRARYDVYPPVTANSKRPIAKKIVRLLQERGLLQAGIVVLHVRCDSGALLNELRATNADGIVHGLDYFESHVRYVREQGFAAAPLNPGRIELPFGVKYDMIVSNHQLTHAIDPRDYLDRVRNALKPGGHILFYNETDHDLLFDSGSEHYRRAEMINYHKQLFVRESFEALLSEAGLDWEYLRHRKTSMMYLARRGTSKATCLPVAPDVIERQRRRIRAWQKVLRRRRPVAALVNSLRWLARPDLHPDAL
jgi:SAM-dependent methyltransferase